MARTYTGTESAYGSIPNLPTSGALSSNVYNILNSALGGNLGALTSGATDVIKNALTGTLSKAETDAMQKRRAEMAVLQGMPGAANIVGTALGNASIMDPANEIYRRQNQGIASLLNLLQGYSGTAALGPGQVQEQENAIAKYESAPQPAAAFAEQERLFNKYSSPALGTMRTSPWSKPSTPKFFIGSQPAPWSIARI